MTAGPLLALLWLAQPTPAAAPADPGARAFQRCLACHSVRPGEDDLPGPNLAGIVSRRAGADPGYPYSPALAAAGRAGLVWDAEALDRFIQDPEAMIPGTAMPFIGRPPAAERAALIDYLARSRR